MFKQIYSPLRIALILASACAASFAQTPKPAAPSTIVTTPEMNTAFKGAPNQTAALIDMPVRVIDAGSHYLGVALVRRTSADQSALSHDKIDEVYYMLEGGGTLVTGGSIVGGKRSETSKTIGPGWSGTSINGGQTKRVSPGDVVFITAGTPHMFTQLDGTIRYLVYRVDPSKSIGLK